MTPSLWAKLGGPSTRMGTKWRLFRERQAVGEALVRCELCHRAPATDLHECLNRAHYPPEVVGQVPDALLALLCNACNTREADQTWARVQLLRQNLARYGPATFHAQVEAFADQVRAFDPKVKIYEIVDYLSL